MPSDVARDELLELLDREGFQRQYDFVYLPMDFRRGCGFGYAFVNLVSPQVALRFRDVFSGFSEWGRPCAAEAEVGWATLQGLSAHVEKYRNSPVMHADVADASKPILLEDGERATFPPPTKKIGLVKRLRTRRRKSHVGVLRVKGSEAECVVSSQ